MTLVPDSGDDRGGRRESQELVEQDGDVESAEVLLEEVHATFLSLGDLWGIALTYGTKAAMAMSQGDYKLGRVFLLESFDASEALLLPEEHLWDDPWVAALSEVSTVPPDEDILHLTGRYKVSRYVL